MKKLVACALLLLLIASCKSKKKGEDKNFFSVSHFLQAQVQELQQGNYRFTRIRTVDGHSDTTAIPKSDLPAYTQDFLSLPDISSPDLKEYYDEANTYDGTLANVLLTYSANNKDQPVRSETVMMEPDSTNTAQPNTILINRVEDGKDSTVIKDMAWHVGRRFQVVTKSTRPGAEERISVVTVRWE